MGYLMSPYAAAYATAANGLSNGSPMVRMIFPKIDLSVFHANTF